MKRLLAVTVLLAGCSGAREGGNLTIEVVNAKGEGVSSFSYAIVDESGQTEGGEDPAQSSKPVRPMKGGEYRIVVLCSTGAAVAAFEVDGDEEVTATLGPGGGLRGQTRADGKPVVARVYMPMPGKDRKDEFSHVVRAKDDGMFSIDRLPPGKWTILAGSDATGYKPLVVDIKEGEIRDLGIIELK